MLLPQQPYLARIIRQQILRRKTLSHREVMRTLARQHHMRRPLHHRPRKLPHMANPRHSAHCATTTRRPMHHRSIQLHHARFIRQPAISHRVIRSVILSRRTNMQCGSKCVLTLQQHLVSLFHRVVTRLARNNHRLLRSSKHRLRISIGSRKQRTRKNRKSTRTKNRTTCRHR